MKNIKVIVYLFIITILLNGCVSPNLDKEISQAKLNKVPVLITKLQNGYPNSANGVNLHINFINLSNKTIKYLDLEVMAINQVGDPIYGEIRRKKTRLVQCMGPVAKNKAWHSDFNDTWFENVWYTSRRIVTLNVTNILIIYMDGTIKIIDKPSLISKMVVK